MPIRPDLRPFYRGPAWLATRERIVKRAKNRCEQCGKPNHRRVWVFSWREIFGGVFTTQLWSRVKGDGQVWHSCADGRGDTGTLLYGTQWKRVRRVRIVCTVAHLNHVSGDDRDENLKFLCQWCHLNYDKLHHRETRATRKDAARPIRWEGVIRV
jgi:hypothetical protein